MKAYRLLTVAVLASVVLWGELAAKTQSGSSAATKTVRIPPSYMGDDRPIPPVLPRCVQITVLTEAGAAVLVPMPLQCSAVRDISVVTTEGGVRLIIERASAPVVGTNGF